MCSPHLDECDLIPSDAGGVTPSDVKANGNDFSNSTRGQQVGSPNLRQVERRPSFGGVSAPKRFEAHEEFRHVLQNNTVKTKKRGSNRHEKEHRVIGHCVNRPWHCAMAMARVRVPYVQVDTKGCVLGEDVASGNLLLQRPELKRGVAQPKPHTCAPSARRPCCQQDDDTNFDTRPGESRRCFAKQRAVEGQLKPTAKRAVEGQLKPNQRW